MTSLEQTSQLRKLLDDVLTLFTAGLLDLWRPLDFSDRNAVMTVLRDEYPALIGQYGEASAGIAADWYAQTRLDSGVTGSFTPDLVLPDLDKISEQVGSTAGYVTKPLNLDNEVSSEAAATETSGTARQRNRARSTLTLDDLPELSDASLARLVDQAQLDLAEPARQTILQGTLADPKYPRYARVPRPDCCAFCALLATRGAVYYELTVGFPSHRCCRCVPAPSWEDAPYEPPANLAAWTAAYQGASGGGKSTSEVLTGMRKTLGVR